MPLRLDEGGRMTGIEKMVVCLEGQLKYWGYMDIGRRHQIEDDLAEARRLAAEEKAQKPPAPIGLVEELREAVFMAIGEASMCWNEPPLGIFDSARAEKIGRDLMDKILSRHTPADDNRPAVTCREADLADWQEHKDEFKKWFAGRNTPAESPEPLAVLADKKSFEVEIGKTKTLGGVTKWAINFWQGGIRTPFYGSTYAECEAKARAYLNGLKDKENI